MNSSTAASRQRCASCQIGFTLNSKTLTKELWRECWLTAIRELTSLDFQKKTWLDINNSNPHYSFSEFMCVYFNDLLSDHDYYYYIDIGWLTQKEYETISEWHHLLAKYNSPNNMDDDNMAVLNDNKWIDIVNIGETARNNLLQLLNKTERTFLNIK